MTIFEPIRRGAEAFIDTLGEGREWLRDRSASAITRFRRTEEQDDTPLARGDSWGLLAADLAETDDEVVVRIEAPGLEQKDFSISVDEGELVVQGQKRFERENRTAHYHLIESAYGAFTRRFSLPCEVDSEGASAKYRSGVLTVRLPRSSRSRRRRIQVEAA